MKRYLVVAGPEREGLCSSESIHKDCYVLEIAMSKDATDACYWYQCDAKLLFWKSNLLNVNVRAIAVTDIASAFSNYLTMHP